MILREIPRGRRIRYSHDRSSLKSASALILEKGRCNIDVSETVIGTTHWKLDTGNTRFLIADHCLTIPRVRYGVPDFVDI